MVCNIQSTMYTTQCKTRHRNMHNTSREASLCIPRLSLTFNEDYIRTIFSSLNLGIISHIYLIRYDSYQKAFIYFKCWDDMVTLDKLKNGEHINIVYTFPWFWKCSLNKNRFTNKH